MLKSFLVLLGSVFALHAAETNFVLKVYDLKRPQFQILFELPEDDPFGKERRGVVEPDPFGADPFGGEDDPFGSNAKKEPVVRVHNMTEGLSELMPLPKRSRATFLNYHPKFILYSTPDAHTAFQALLEGFKDDHTDVTYRVDTTFVALPKKQVEAQPAFREKSGLPPADALRLFRAGEGRVIHTASMRILSGVNAAISSRKEIFVASPLPMQPRKPPKGMPMFGNPGSPAFFEYQSRGAVVNITVSSLKDGSLQIAAVPSLDVLDGWTELGGDKRVHKPDASDLTVFAKPLIHEYSASTILKANPGETVVLFSATMEDKTRDLLVCLLRVTEVD